MPFSFTYGGLAIFGQAVRSTTEIAPRAVQQNTFFGLNGVEELDGGGRGGETIVTGIISGTGALGYQANWSAAAGLQDGVARQLATPDGTFPLVILASWSPAGELTRTPAGVVQRKYRATFRHLD